jgi:hypothetical protein
VKAIVAGNRLSMLLPPWGTLADGVTTEELIFPNTEAKLTP